MKAPDPCTRCGREFILAAREAEFLRSRGLSLPKRCRTCRAIRRSTPRRGGRVEHFSLAFGFIDGDDGIRYWASASSVDPRSLPLRAGDQVTFRPDLDFTPDPGFKPRALHVQLQGLAQQEDGLACAP